MTAVSLGLPPVTRNLRHALLVDAAASGGMGLLLAVGHRFLANVLGLPAGLLFWAGLFLVPFAAFLVWVARKTAIPQGLVRFIVAGNVLWVIASIAIAPAGIVEPTGLGLAFLIAQAAAVIVFVILEYRGLRQMSV